MNDLAQAVERINHAMRAYEQGHEGAVYALLADEGVFVVSDARVMGDVIVVRCIGKNQWRLPMEIWQERKEV